MTEMWLGVALGLFVAMPVAIALWTELRAFRELNEGLGAMIMEIEAAQNQMKAGIIAAIHERAMADEKPDRGTRAH